MNDELDFTPSCGNVFADLGLDEPDTALGKSELARQISRLIREHGWSQTQAADHLGIDQPKVSAIMRGRLKGFSIERLLGLLIRLGQDVTISVGSAADEGTLRVIAADAGAPFGEGADWEEISSPEVDYLRAKRERLGFLPVPTEDYLAALGKSASRLQATVLHAVTRLSAGTVREPDRISALARFCRTIGMTRTETDLHVRLSLAKEFGRFPMTVRARGGIPGDLTPMEECEAALNRVEAQYPEALTEALTAAEDAVRSAFRN